MMKRMILRLVAALFLCTVFAAGCALAEEAADITTKCKFKVSEGDRGNLYDRNVRSTWKYTHTGAYVGVHLPKETRAGWLRIEWFFDPKGFELIEYDADLNELRRRDQTATFPNIYTMLELLPEASYLQLRMTAKNQQIGNLRVYSAGDLPKDVQVWERPVEKADLMVVSTHQDDELLFLGGTIPYYNTALKKPTIVVYMTNCSRNRRKEALNGLWVMGVRTYPEFINLTDKKVDTIREGISLWGGKENILAELVERIRRFKPEVIVTQDLNGEYGHNQHKITARAMKYAIDAAADPTQFPESQEKYGEWQVKKLYHHLYGENTLKMDWKTKLDALNGYSPFQVAKLGMEQHVSQLDAYRIKDGGKYDNSKFGLYFTTVGEDVEKNDFLEHIDPNASADYIAEHGVRELSELWEDLPEVPEDEPEDAGQGDAPDGDQEDGENSAEAEEGDEFSTAKPEDEGQVSDEQPELAMETPHPAVTAAPQSATESSGGNAVPAILMIAAGFAAVGGGGWYAYRTFGFHGRHRHRNRRLR